MSRPWEDEKWEKNYLHLQWKGTQPCFDYHCKCGNHIHIDDEFFADNFKCMNCGQLYHASSKVRVWENNNPNEHEEKYYVKGEIDD